MAVIVLKETGAAGTLRALKLLDKDVAKGLEKEINAIGGMIVDDARGFVPERPLSANGGDLYNWRSTPPKRPRGKRTASGAYGTTLTRGGAGWPAWIGSESAANIKKSRREYVVTVRSMDASLAIYEIAGTKGSGDSPQGRAFIRNLPALGADNGSHRGRVLVRSVKKNYRAAKGQLADIVQRAETACRERLGA